SERTCSSSSSRKVTMSFLISWSLSMRVSRSSGDEPGELGAELVHVLRCCFRLATLHACVLALVDKKPAVLAQHGAVEHDQGIPGHPAQVFAADAGDGARRFEHLLALQSQHLVGRVGQHAELGTVAAEDYHPRQV